MTESKKEEVDETTNQTDSTDESKTQGQEEDTSQKDEGTEDKKEENTNVTLTKEEHEKLLRKSEDFDGIIKKQKLEKFKKKTESKEEEESEEKFDMKKVEQVATDAAMKVFQEKMKKDYESNLDDAFEEFIKDNSWAGDDEVIGKISEGFTAGDAVTKDELLVKLKNSARDSFPVRYEQALEAKLKAKILAEKNNIDTGAGGGSSEHKDGETNIEVTAEDQRMADKFFGGDVKRYIKNK